MWTLHVLCKDNSRTQDVSARTNEVTVMKKLDLLRVNNFTLNVIPKEGVFSISTRVLPFFGFGTDWSDFLDTITNADHDIYQEEIIIIPRKFPWPSFAFFERIFTGFPIKHSDIDEVLDRWDIISDKLHGDGVQAIGFSISYWLMLRDGSGHRIYLNDNSEKQTESVENLYRESILERDRSLGELDDELNLKKSINRSDISSVFERREITFSQYPFFDSEELREVTLVKNLLWEERFGRKTVQQYITNCLCEKIRQQKVNNFADILNLIPTVKPNMGHWDER